MLPLPAHHSLRAATLANHGRLTASSVVDGGEEGHI